MQATVPTVQSASTRQDRVNYPVEHAHAAVPRSPVYINIWPIYTPTPVYNAVAVCRGRPARETITTSLSDHQFHGGLFPAWHIR